VKKLISNPFSRRCSWLVLPEHETIYFLTTNNENPAAETEISAARPEDETTMLPYFRA